MLPSGFNNNNNETRCYFNTTIQMLYFNIMFRRLILNVVRKNMINSLDINNNQFAPHYIFFCLKELQDIFGEIRLVGMKAIIRYDFFIVTNIRIAHQVDAV